MSLFFEWGEPCNHPGCLSHVTHPCEGCGRVAGRGSVRISKGPLGETRDIWLIKRISPDEPLLDSKSNRSWNEERRWTQEYTAAFFEESIAERQTRELAEHYHDSVDEADILICGNSRGFPETSEQRRASYENARRTREELYNRLRPLGVTPTQWTEAIRMAAQHTRGRCRD